MTKVHPLYICKITLTDVFPHRSFFFPVCAEGEGCFDEGSHSARRGVDGMFWSSELLKVLGNCFLQHEDQSMIAHFKGGKH